MADPRPCPGRRARVHRFASDRTTHDDDCTTASDGRDPRQRRRSQSARAFPRKTRRRRRYRARDLLDGSPGSSAQSTSRRAGAGRRHASAERRGICRLHTDRARRTSRRVCDWSQQIYVTIARLVARATDRYQRMPRPGRTLSPPQLLAASIEGLILTGTLLLTLPMAKAPGRTVGVLNALFTSTSAVCVTGLIVVDTPNDFSTFGHLVILLLIQFGGLGYMTISTVLASLLGRTVTLQERLTLQEALNLQDLEGLIRFAINVLKLTLVFELTGAFLLTLHWWPQFGAKAAWYGLFHAVSAFNNAGFTLWSDNLIRWRGDLTVNAVISGLIIAGGLGFFVLSELTNIRLRKIALSLHTKLVLSAT